uniref:hypothetical protein n=1 Tax=Ningiella ruwaisensis TaxID=2364274 RepID=UPI00109F7916|nr:hypothetical protein [Ningiella ruwaisensis]
MNELQKLKQQVKDLQAQIEQLEKQAEQPFIERDINDDDYYFIDKDNNIRSYSETGHAIDEILYNQFNYFINKQDALNMQAYNNRCALFKRKAIEFAEGYSFIGDKNNFSVRFKVNRGVFVMASNSFIYNQMDIYMTEENAKAFCDWCNQPHVLERLKQDMGI